MHLCDFSPVRSLWDVCIGRDKPGEGPASRGARPRHVLQAARIPAAPGLVPAERGLRGSQKRPERIQPGAHLNQHRRLGPQSPRSVGGVPAALGGGPLQGSFCRHDMVCASIVRPSVAGSWAGLALSLPVSVLTARGRSTKDSASPRRRACGPQPLRLPPLWEPLKEKWALTMLVWGLRGSVPHR